MAQALDIYASPLPFSNKQVKASAPEGTSVADIINLILPDGHMLSDDVGAIVTINGHEILRQHWRNVKPKTGTIINVRVVPMKGGGKNPLTTILSIAIMIAAPYAGAALAGVAGFGGVWAGSLFFSSAQIYGFAISIAGKLLISALSPAPKQPTQARNPLENPTQFIEGAQNSINAYGVVPICLGTNRMIPPQAARPFTETQNGHNYVRQLFTWGWGGQLVVDNFSVGESTIEDFTDFDLENKLNGDMHSGFTIYSDDISPEEFSIVLNEADGFTTRTTHIDVNEAIIDVTFFRGLAKFNGGGWRLPYNVQLELQYALSGVSPQVWSTPATSFQAYSGEVLVLDDVEVTTQKKSIMVGFTLVSYFVGYRKDIITLDAFSGTIDIIKGYNIGKTANAAKAPILPSGNILLATALVLTKKPSATVGASITTVETFSDDRQAGLFTANGWRGNYFSTANDFEPVQVGTTVTVSSGTVKADPFNITSAQSEVLRRSVRVLFPAQGTYDIRIRRITPDKESLGLDEVATGRIFDEATLTSIKGVTYTNPVTLEGINGTAIRIKANDQLNGALSTVNAIVSSILPDYDLASDTWINRLTSNPASLYRYVMQSPANEKAIADSKINLDELADWHTYCEAQGYTYNRVIDFETSVDDVLRDIASAGAASPAMVDGKRTVVIDRVKNDIVQMITPRNSWGYTADLVYFDAPHALRMNFRNADKSYIQDERIVYADGYNEDNATKFESLDLPSCTSADLAFKHGRRYLATAILRRETHTFMMDIENLVALRGNRVKLVHDIPIVGVGDARVKSVASSGSPELITSVTLDDTITIPTTATYYMRVRLHDGSWLYKELVTTVGDATTFEFVTPFAIPYTADSPAQRLFNAGDLAVVVETGTELDLIITRIEPQDDLSARITCVNYAPEIFDAENITIPAFTSHITVPLSFIRPIAPVLVGEPQSDESVMLLNSDGSFLKRAIFTLDNPNDGEFVTTVFVRRTGTDSYSSANILEASDTRVVITGLDDNTYYDVQIRLKRIGGTVYSLPLQISSFLFVGAGGTPSDPADFEHQLSGTLSLFEWTANDDLDHSHAVIKFSGVFTGATYETAQDFADNIIGNTYTAPFQAGTYFLKFVDISGNVSDIASTVITADINSLGNAVATLSEHNTSPVFAGTKDNVEVSGTGIMLSNTDLTDGYYYFSNDLDLGDVYTSTLSATIVASGVVNNNIFNELDIFAMPDVFGAGSNNIFDELDIFAMPDIYGIGVDGWSVSLEYRITNDPTLSPIDWGGGWLTFTAGSLNFRAIQFRLKLTSLAQNITPKVTTLSVLIDMPDRVERGENLTCLGTGSPPDGATVTYAASFNASPAVAITLQDAATDDQIIYTTKSASGFSFKVYNGTTMGYVTRTFDYIASGYGRVL